MIETRYLVFAVLLLLASSASAYVYSGAIPATLGVDADLNNISLTTPDETSNFPSDYTFSYPIDLNYSVEIDSQMCIGVDLNTEYIQQICQPMQQGLLDDINSCQNLLVSYDTNRISEIIANNNGWAQQTLSYLYDMNQTISTFDIAVIQTEMQRQNSTIESTIDRKWENVQAWITETWMPKATQFDSLNDELTDWKVKNVDMNAQLWACNQTLLGESERTAGMQAESTLLWVAFGIVAVISIFLWARGEGFFDGFGKSYTG